MRLDRFEFEERLMKCWHVTEDIDVVAGIIGDTSMSAEDQDKLMNILIGMKELYNARFSQTFQLFETLVHNGTFNGKTEDFPW